MWAHVDQVLRGENTGPQTTAKFYKAVVQAVLLFGSKTWNLPQSALAQLKGFHVRAAYKMARKLGLGVVPTIFLCIQSRQTFWKNAE